ncbi:MAG: hypothetical protein WC551_03160 [Patescibacteria group bacterium]
MGRLIFLPSDIYICHDQKPGAEPKFAKFKGEDGEDRFKYFSTGRLEKALHDKDEVWVLVETQHLGLDFCQWWLALIPKDRLIVVPDLTSCEAMGTLDELRSTAAKLGLGIDEDTLMQANTWMRLLYLFEEKGVVRAHATAA